MSSRVDLTKLRKLESPKPGRAARSLTGWVTAIVKVSTPSYRPPGIKVRGAISDRIFTAEFPAEILDDLEHDPQVESVAISRTLQSETD
jgi:hypothetical protein